MIFRVKGFATQLGRKTMSRVMKPERLGLY